MSECRGIGDPGEPASAPPGETFLGRPGDLLARWIREAAEVERQARSRLTAGTEGGAGLKFGRG